MSSVDAIGPGTPTPLTLIPRAKGDGRRLAYKAKVHRVQADVAKGKAGQSVAALFRPRPPVRPPGVKGFGKGSVVDSRA
ncbi:MAG TPA: hypothetical protein VG370_02340 [Chloroflexota bacterium]|jgi:hypothetical protein|nr:hypothetical protein [Chloroflexota bacterium]